jgi:hypothetical protein
MSSAVKSTGDAKLETSTQARQQPARPDTLIFCWRGPVAQLDRALRFERRGWEFKSLRVRQVDTASSSNSPIRSMESVSQHNVSCAVSHLRVEDVFLIRRDRNIVREGIRTTGGPGNGSGAFGGEVEEQDFATG